MFMTNYSSPREALARENFPLLGCSKRNKGGASEPSPLGCSHHLDSSRFYTSLSHTARNQGCMATLEPPTASLDEPAERANPAFDPTAVPLDPAPLAQLSRHSQAQPEHARAEQEQDLIDLGREQLFAGSTRASSTGQRRRDRQQDATSRTVHESASQAVTEQSQDAMVRPVLYSQPCPCLR